MIKKWLRKPYRYYKFQKEKKLLKDLLPEEVELIRQVRHQNLTYLSIPRLASIVQSVKEIKASKTSGMLVEAGCALGGSAILIAKLKSESAALHVFDVFGMIPPPTEEDTQDVHERYNTIVEGKSTGLGGDLYYGYEENLYDKVVDNFRSFGIEPTHENVGLIKGLVQETMDINEEVAFAHIDVDWYEPVKTCLEQLWPNLIVGGSIILDDYHDWGGCRKATDEYFKDFAGQYSMDDRFGSLKVTRIARG